MPGLFDLGEDVITGNLIPLLEPKDIQNLGQTCRYARSIVNQGIVWREMYHKTFGKAPTPYSLTELKWPQLYKLRKDANLYTWGKFDGRLGLSRDAFPEGIMPGSVPWPVELFHIPLADVTCGGLSFQVLTSDGDLYCTGSFHSAFRKGAPGPIERDSLRRMDDGAGSADHRLLRELPQAVIPHMRGPHRPGVMMMPDVKRANEISATKKTAKKVDTKQGLLFQLLTEGTAKIIAVSSGRQHVLALDNDGEVWTWDTDFLEDSVGVKLKFPGLRSGSIFSVSSPILKIRAGWNMSSVYALNLGIVVWMCRKKMSRSSQRSEGLEALYVVIPETASTSDDDKVVDYVCLDNELVYLKGSGKLFSIKVHRDAESGETLLGRLLPLASKLKKVLSRTDKITRLSGSFRTLVAFTLEDHVIVLRQENGQEMEDAVPRIYEELQNVECVSVAVGDWHYMALLKSGKVLTWGLNNGGCLGNGDLGVKRIDSPTEVKVEGKVLAIAAGGWQSGAIVAKEH
ncbi:unnamed protein product [Kuraishia capsulata CBS 1993]|uniref:F-box domain-containing protein n=1 Tax=Kuraishia capsulata CBS 1993 TaxID=1382522 RepID=W6MIK6_9ASCO|nr:uncharacterized protein KUCA_T00000152001 [Kuraishia capsulata CBS 1993]CDK24192.1 unnamed protein product [Kuraishia capsulata CBS 1993]